MLRSSFGNLILAIIARMLCGNHLNHLDTSDENQEEVRRKRRSTDSDGNDLTAHSTNVQDGHDDYDDYDDYDEDFADQDETYNEDLDEEYIAIEKVSLLMAEQDRSYLSTLGHQFEDMVLSCTFRGIQCR